MEPYLAVVLTGIVVSIAAYGLYQFSSASYTGEFVIPAVTVSTTSSIPATRDNSADTPTQTNTETFAENTPMQSEIKIAPKIIFTEIMYNPWGADEGREWVEMFSEDAVNVSGWKLFEANTNHRMVLKKGSDEIKGYQEER